MSNRRNFFARVAAAGAGLLAAQKLSAQPAAVNLPIQTPDLPKLPWRMVDGVKEFRLTAEVVRTEFIAGRAVDGWGFNGSIPGPTIEVNEAGDGVIVIGQATPDSPALEGFRRSGQIAVKLGPKEYALSATVDEQAKVAKFFAACERK